MMIPQNVLEYENLLVEYFEAPKVLVFLSESSEVSKNYEKALDDIQEDLEEIEVCLIKILKENKELEPLYEKYQIEKVPTILILNFNLSTFKKLTDISPGDLLIQIYEFGAASEKEIEKEEKKYKMYFNRYLKNNKICLFSFSDKNVENHQNLRNYLVEKNLSFKELFKKNFKETNSITILACLALHLKGESAQDLENSPILYFNKNLITSFEEGKKILEIHEDLINNLNEKEKDQFEKFVKENPVVVFINSNEENSQEQNEFLKTLESKNVVYTYIDMAEKQNLFNILKKNLKSESLNFPVLKNSENLFFEVNKLKDSIIEKINKDFIINTMDDKIRFLINSNKIFVFMKGSKENPFCKFSRKMVNYLNNRKADFGFFNIMTATTEFKDAIKEFSKWKTFPQLYINQKLVGGNDVIAQLEEIGEMEKLFESKKG